MAYLLGDPHPAFAQHFSDQLYDDPSNDFAPFGTDEGADLLADWTDRRHELGRESTLRELLSDELADVDQFINVDVPGSEPDLDGIVIGAGFTLLRLTGQIDSEGRAWLMKSLQRSQSFYGDAAPEFTRMLQDLESFTSW
jgi:uncharacterized protein YfeS